MANEEDTIEKLLMMEAKAEAGTKTKSLEE